MKIKIQKYFTLVELLVSMGVFMIIMLALFTFFSSAQKIWTDSASKTMAFENARIALDLMERDIHSIMYDGDYMNFQLNTDTEINFISAVQTKDPASYSNICEVSYRVDTQGWLERAQINDQSTAAKYNFSSCFKSSTAFNFDSSDYQKVIPYVADLTFYCYPKGVSLTAANKLPATPNNLTPIPNTIIIDLTLLDKSTWDKWLSVSPTRAIEPEFVTNTKRKFSKTVYLGK